MFYQSRNLNEIDVLSPLYSLNHPVLSVNVTKNVRVPSSEHVAEIVGRQGCKIKALRAKTNTYIKTPVRGSEPIFVITGRERDVDSAVSEIETAAAHFSNIRANRRQGSEGQVIGYVKVPYKVVGLVVGQRGTTIKRIQQDTNTYIVTPSRDKEPVFEITGNSDDVGLAFDEIKTHVRIRTGTLSEKTDSTMSLTICEIDSNESEITETSKNISLFENENNIFSNSFLKMPNYSNSVMNINRYGNKGFDNTFSNLNEELCNRNSFNGLDNTVVNTCDDLCNRFTNSLSIPNNVSYSELSYDFCPSFYDSCECKSDKFKSNFSYQKFSSFESPSLLCEKLPRFTFLNKNQTDLLNKQSFECYERQSISSEGSFVEKSCLFNK